MRHANDSYTRSQQVRIRRGYIKHGKHGSKDSRQTLSMLKHDQKLHKAKPKHASMMVQRQDVFLGKMEEYKASVLCMQGVNKPTWDRGKTC